MDNNKIILDKLGFSPEQRWVVSDIKTLFQCCYEFASRILQEEIDYFTKHGETYQKLYEAVMEFTGIEEDRLPKFPVLNL